MYFLIPALIGQVSLVQIIFSFVRCACVLCWLSDSVKVPHCFHKFSLFISLFNLTLCPDANNASVGMKRFNQACLTSLYLYNKWCKFSIDSTYVLLIFQSFAPVWKQSVSLLVINGSSPFPSSCSPLSLSPSLSLSQHQLGTKSVLQLLDLDLFINFAGNAHNCQKYILFERFEHHFMLTQQQ